MTDFDPLYSMSPADFMRLRALLTELFHDNDGLSPHYFWDGRSHIPGATEYPKRSAPRRGELGRLLSKAGLGKWEGASLVSDRRIHALEGVFLATDFPTPSISQDRVFPWVDEAKLLIRHLKRTTFRQPGRVLDLGCGPGTIALVLSRLWRDSTILGRESSERSLEISEFNRRLNDIDIQRCSFDSGDLYSGLRPADFDLIVAHPPFALQPPNWPEYSHSRGGELGHEVLKPMIAQARQYLRHPESRLVALCYSLGTAEEPTLLLNTLRAAGMSRELERDSDLFYVDKSEGVWRFFGKKAIKRNPMPIRYMAIRFGDPNYKIHEGYQHLDDYIDWIEGLIQQGYTHLHYVVIDLPRSTLDGTDT